MTQPGPSYRIFPLGDSAITIDFGNVIDEKINEEVLHRFYYLQQHPLSGMMEAAPAYSSLTIYYDLLTARKKAPEGTSVFEWMKKQIIDFLQQPVPAKDHEEKLVRIPVCYEGDMAPDIHHLAQTKKITVEEIVQLHVSTTYKVFMLGFLPGFAYMGEVDERISIPRKTEPTNVQAGSVGIAGKQTGVYPLGSPGGWQIIGRTPMKLFDKDKKNPAVLEAGDRVQFYSISKNEFKSY